MNLRWYRYFILTHYLLKKCQQYCATRVFCGTLFQTYMAYVTFVSLFCRAFFCVVLQFRWFVSLLRSCVQRMPMHRFMWSYVPSFEDISIPRLSSRSLFQLILHLCCVLRILLIDFFPPSINQLDVSSIRSQLSIVVCLDRQRLCVQKINYQVIHLCCAHFFLCPSKQFNQTFDLIKRKIKWMKKSSAQKILLYSCHCCVPLRNKAKKRTASFR